MQRQGLYFFSRMQKLITMCTQDSQAPMGLKHSSEKAMQTSVTQKGTQANPARIFKNPTAIKITSNAT